MATSNDEPDGQPINGTPPATDRPPSTVAEEAALLVDLLSRRGWGAGSGMPSASSHAHRAAGDGSHGHDGAGDEANDPDAPGHDASGATSGARPGGIPLGQQGPECTCGGREPAACRVCPVCQLISFVQQVNPDTIERVADFVGFAATALRDLATAQRERSERSERPSGTESPERAEPTPSTEQTEPSARPGAARDDAEEGPA